ncbi:MAG: AMIN domain-containing protein, partial [Myxococcales bacterium]|nr:AMIN domain-containing protein [Myxococcales bacterium]
MQIPPSVPPSRATSWRFALGRGIALAAIAALCAAPVAAATKLQAVRTTVGANGTVIEIWLDGELSYTAPLHIDNPPRLVVDFHGAVSELKTHRLQIGTPEVAGLRFGQHADKVRWVVDAGFSEEQLRSATLVRTDRGVALLVGDVLQQAARDMRGELTFKAAAAPSPTRSTAQASAPPPTRSTPRAAAPTRSTAQAAEPSAAIAEA